MKSRMTNGLLSFLRHNTIALIALFVALGGTAYAATALPAHSVGTKQLKKSAVTSVKVKDNSITGKDVLESSLGKVPSAASADAATNATHAASADTLGGIGPSVFGTDVRYCGDDFRPRSDAYQYDYLAAGEMESTTAFASFSRHVSLPQGAKANRLTFFFHNRAAGNSGSLYLWRFDAVGNAPAVADVSSSTASGYNSVSVAISPAEVIDNTKYVYQLVWTSSTSTNGLVAAQIDYTLP